MQIWIAMGKRKNKEEETEKIRRKLKKWQKRLKKNEETEEDGCLTPTDFPPRERAASVEPPILNTDLDLPLEISDNEEVAEELLLALGPEGADTHQISEPIHPQLASRWKNIMREGLKKETREEISKKYPDPENFDTTAPSLNPEIKAVMSDTSIKRDYRLVVRQKMTGKVLIAIGKAMTSVMKGNFNSKQLIECLSDAAKITTDIYHQDLSSRKYFALAGTSSLIKDAIKNEKSDETLFGSACSEKIKLAQTIQRTGAQIKEKQKNFRGPLPPQQKPRSGQYQYRQPAKPYLRPHKKRQPHHRKRSPPRKQRHN